MLPSKPAQGNSLVAPADNLVDQDVFPDVEDHVGSGTLGMIVTILGQE